MKQGIHPEYVDCTVRCSCGNTWVTKATKAEIRVDLCDKCHPFYTGTQKLVDTGGRVQRFADKFGAAAEARLASEAAAKEAKAAKAADEEAKRKAAAEAKAAEKAKRAAEYERQNANRNVEPPRPEGEESAAAEAEAAVEAEVADASEVAAEAEAPAEPEAAVEEAAEAEAPAEESAE